ncbi:MAG: nitroreductase family protein [Eubacterium sp.]|nr:nitroreductase family protein [Eubacterium sp.]
MEFQSLIEERFSCRSFKDLPVEADKIQAIVNAGQIAPTANNRQPFHIWVFSSEDSLEKVRACTPCHFGAPVILALGCQEDAGWVRSFDNMTYASVDASIVGTHMLLEAQNQGLGSTWVAFFDPAKLRAQFPDQDFGTLVALFPIGYPADDAKPSDNHYQRKALSELVTEL